MSIPELSAVIPVYNDRKALERAIPRSLQCLSAISPDFELIIAEDGSSDGSADLVKEYAAKDGRIRLLHSDARLGRGTALNRAFADARSPVVCYYDVDLATDMRHLKELIGAIEDGYDIATGSRLLSGSRIKRTGGRELASRGYNFLVRSLLMSSLHDHQCGFKAFRRDRVIATLGSCQGNPLVLGHRDPCPGGKSGLSYQRISRPLGAGGGNDGTEKRCDRDGARSGPPLVAVACGKS